MAWPADLALLTSSALYVGFQWTIRLVVYPQLARVGGADFVAYERAHQRAVSWAVGPLFLALGVSCLTALASRLSPATLAAAVGVAAILGLTGFGEVPQHRRLSTGFDPMAYRRLLAVDSGRLAVALAVLVVALVQVRGDR